jgi:hypothetical protein
METYRLSQNGYRMLKPYASAKLIFTNIFHIMDITYSFPNPFEKFTFFTKAIF